MWEGMEKIRDVHTGDTGGTASGQGLRAGVSIYPNKTPIKPREEHSFLLLHVVKTCLEMFTGKHFIPYSVYTQRMFSKYATFLKSQTGKRASFMLFWKGLNSKKQLLFQPRTAI